MRRLFPVTDQTAAPAAPANPAGGDREWSLAELAAAYAYPEPDPGPAGGGDGTGAWLRANMVSTLDGAAQHDGRSQPISSAA
ncbi:pyrimidine reductase family protein, partial [Streptomyces sp. TRM76130]|nr:pyrimidine reductase family protein [Streptomyces sp. TRM76130]